MGAIAASGAKPVVPRRRTTAQWRSFDSHLYKERNLIERFFNKIKHFRRIATRYDKLARNYAGFLNRSEEHTSELQSLMRISYAVFCLKKKNNHTRNIPCAQ